MRGELHGSPSSESATQASRLALVAPVRHLSSLNRRPLSAPPSELSNAYMAAYAGSDRSRDQVLRWCGYLDGLHAAEVEPDHIADALDHWVSVPRMR